MTNLTRLVVNINQSSRTDETHKQDQNDSLLKPASSALNASKLEHSSNWQLRSSHEETSLFP